MCPAKALGEIDYPQGLTDKKACAAHSADLNQKGIAPCGICIKVCPVGEDREFFKRSDVSIYSDKKCSPIMHKAWEHARSYGLR